MMTIIMNILLKMIKIWGILSHAKQQKLTGRPTELDTKNDKSFESKTANMKIDSN